MLPTLGDNANGVKVVPKNADEIKIGDIISFQSGELTIVHRVVSKGEDNNGIFFVTRGDNNPETDGKVYFKDIKYVTIALVY
jgi:signal peptidase I